MVVGGGAFFAGFLIALGEWDASYMLYVTVPGLVAMLGVGMPMVIVGASMMRRSRSWTDLHGPTFVLRDRRGTPRLQLSPSGLRF